MLRVVKLGVLLAISIGANANPPRGCQHCEDWQGAGLWYHHFVWPPPPYLDYDDTFYHLDDQPLTCYEQHDVCWGALLPELEAISKAGYTNSSVARFAMLHHDVVEYNADRQAVQVRGCGDAIIANFPADPQSLAALVAKGQVRLALDQVE